VQVQKENLAALRQQLQQVREFVEVGTRPRSDLYQQQAEVAQAELDLLNARQQYDLGRTQLIETLQLDPFGAYGFQAPAVADSVESPARYDLAALSDDSAVVFTVERRTTVGIVADYLNL